MKLVFTNIVLLLTIYSFGQGQEWILEQCIDSAYTHNKSLQIAENNQHLAELKRHEVRANLLPKVFLNGEYKYFIELPYQLMPLSLFGGPQGKFNEVQFGVPHNINGSIVIQAPLYSPSLHSGIQKTTRHQQIVALQSEKTYEEVYFEVATLYHNIQLVKGQLAFVDSTIVNLNIIHKNVALLADQDLSNMTDVQKVELKQSSLETHRLQLLAQIEQLNNALKFITGVDTEIVIPSGIEMINLSTYEPGTNKDLALLQLQQEMIRIDLKTFKRSRYVPELGFTAAYGTQGFGYDISPNEFLNFYPIGYVGVRMSYPLFDRTRSKNIDQKTIELENNQLQQELLEEKLQVDIENSILKLTSSFNQVALQEEHIHLAKNIYQQEFKRYKAGTSSINDLLLAHNELFQSHQTYLQRIAAFIANDLELKKISNNISNNH